MKVELLTPCHREDTLILIADLDSGVSILTREVRLVSKREVPEFSHHSVPLCSLSGSNDQPPPFSLYVCQGHLFLVPLFTVSRLKPGCIIRVAALFRKRKGPIVFENTEICQSVSTCKIHFSGKTIVQKRKSSILCLNRGGIARRLLLFSDI